MAKAILLAENEKKTTLESSICLTRFLNNKITFSILKDLVPNQSKRTSEACQKNILKTIAFFKT
jgi:hypothetical protein